MMAARRFFRDVRNVSQGLNGRVRKRLAAIELGSDDAFQLGQDGRANKDLPARIQRRRNRARRAATMDGIGDVYVRIEKDLHDAFVP